MQLASTCVSFKQGVQFTLDKTYYRILYCDEKSVYVENDMGERSGMSLAALQGCVGNSLEFVVTKKELPVIPTLTDTQQYIVERKKTYIEFALKEAPYAPTSKVNAERAKLKAAYFLKDPAPPGLSTINGWIKQYRENSFSEFALLPEGGKGRNSKFDAIITDLADDFITDYILCSEPYTAVETHKMFKDKAEVLGFVDGEIPCYSTFANWVKDLSYFAVVAAQDGKVGLSMASRQSLQKYECPNILDRVEFDAIHVQLGLLDNYTRQYKGSVIIMVAIDVKSRCVLGYSMHVGPGGETVELTTKCVQHAVLPKENDETRPSGKMSLAVCDAGGAFVSSHFLSFLGQFNINRLTTPTKKPHRKPFVESFFRGLRKKFLSKLIGYLGSSRFKGVYKEKDNLKKEATLTVAEFQDMFERYIYENYHQSAHEGLRNRTPKSVWDHAVGKMPSLITYPREIELFASWGGRMDSRKLHPTRGITINNNTYNTRGLNTWYSELKGNPTYKDKPVEISVSHSKLNIARIVVFHPFRDDWKILPNTDTNAINGMSALEFEMELENKYVGIEKGSREVFNAKNDKVHQAAIERKHEEVKRKKAEKVARRKAKREAEIENGKSEVVLGQGKLSSQLEKIVSENQLTESASEPSVESITEDTSVKPEASEPSDMKRDNISEVKSYDIY